MAILMVIKKVYTNIYTKEELYEEYISRNYNRAGDFGFEF